MKEHQIGGNFMVKYFGEDSGKGFVFFPSEISEISDSMVIRVRTEGGAVKEFPYTIEKLFSNAYRGFSLQHQGGESASMDPAEKEERKAARKDQNDKIKKLLAALAAKGKSIDDLLAE